MKPVPTATETKPQGNAFAFAGSRRNELLRASIVAEIFSFAAQHPKLGRCAVINTILLLHLGEDGVSERSLWRWLNAFERHGLAGLVDTRKGNSGRPRKAVAS